MKQQTSLCLLALACFLEQGSTLSPPPQAAHAQRTPTTSSSIESPAFAKLSNEVTLTSSKDATTVTTPWLTNFLEERNQIPLSPSFTRNIKNDASRVEIVNWNNLSPQEQGQQKQISNGHPLHLDAHPCKLLMQGSAPYIAQNLGKTVVFHVPSDAIDNKNHNVAYPSKNILSDIAMTWMLGMKIVLVLGSSEQLQDDEQHQDAAALLRTEVERRLNHCLYEARGGPRTERQLEGNVIGGHFYTAKRVGIATASDQEGQHHVIHHTGYAARIDKERIHRMLHDNNDIVLLTSHGQGSKGQAISVDGHQLTASVATALKAYKVIYLSRKGPSSSQDSSSARELKQLPLSFAKSIADCHKVYIQQSKAAAVSCNGPAHVTELLNNLVWASWAVENGVTSAHIVNPTDGAILEELFTSRNGSNICLYNDENVHGNVDGEDEDDVEDIVWEENTADDTSPAPTTATRFISSTAFACHSSTNNRGQGKTGAFTL